MRIKTFDLFDRVNEGSQGGGNKFIIVRFGNTPDPRVTQFLGQEARINKRTAAIMKGPGSIITMFETHLTKEALIQGFDALGITYNLYQVVHTSGGGTGPRLVARKRTPAIVKAELDAAVADERWEDATRLRDELAQLEGRPIPHNTNDNPGGGNESHTHKYSSFILEKEEEEYVNGTSTEEFNKLVSELVDHEIKELEAGEKEEGISMEILKKIKDYLVQNGFYVGKEKEEGEGEGKKEGEEE